MRHALLDSSTPASVRDELAALLGSVFRPHPKQREMIDTWAADTERLTLLALEQGHVLGAMVVRRTTSQHLQSYGPPFGVDLQALLGERAVGALQLLAVHPDRRHQGIGRGLGQALVERLEERGATALVGVSWDHGRGQGSRGMFEANGFEVLAESTTFYARMHQQTGQVCRYCRPEPCSCNAVLFLRA